MPHIRRVLDNISDVNANAANRRVAELSSERDRIEAKIESIKNQMLAAHDINSLIQDVRTFCNGLELTLRSALANERQLAARRCVHSIVIDRANDCATLNLRKVPTTVLGQHDVSTTAINVQLKNK